jgi:hypothetical protein
MEAGSYSNPVPTGKAQIISVSNSTTCIVSTSVSGGAAFSSTTLVAPWIPGPHPNDAPADGSISGPGPEARDAEYMTTYAASAGMLKNRSVAGADAAYTYMITSTGYPSEAARQPSFYILPR